jgi:glutamate synthase domain-containing protein 3
MISDSGFLITGGKSLAEKVTSTSEINAAIKKQLGRSKTVKITGLSGQNYIAVGLTTEKQLMFDGSSGDFFGALNNGAIINFKGNARRFLGDTMSDGGIILQGNAQRGVGHAMTGGIIVVRGNVNGDIGQLMKSGTIIVSGNCGPRAGAYMLGGELIVAGNIGEDVGLNMVGGVIYVGGKARALGNNSQVQNLTINDESKLKKYFNHYGIDKDTGEFNKIVPVTNTPWKDKVFDLKPGTDKGPSSVENETRINKDACEIVSKTRSDLLSLHGPVISDEKSYLDRLSIIPIQTKPIKDIKFLDADLDTQISIGGRLDSPLVLDIPFLLSNRGSGVVSKSCKMAYIFAAAKLKTALDNAGGTYPEEFELNKKHGGKLIHHWNTSRLGVYPAKKIMLSLVTCGMYLRVWILFYHQRCSTSTFRQI